MNFITPTRRKQQGFRKRLEKFGRFRTHCGPICRLSVGSLSILGNTSRDRSLDVSPNMSTGSDLWILNLNSLIFNLQSCHFFNHVFFVSNTKNKLKFLIISSRINKAIESTNGRLYRLCQGCVTERKQKMLRVRLHNMIIFQPIRRRLSFKLANHDHRQIWNELWRPKLQSFLFTSTILIMERWVWVCKQSSVHLTYAF